MHIQTAELKGIPFTATSAYKLSEEIKKRNISLCTGWETGNGGNQYLSQLNGSLDAELKILEENTGKVSFEVTYSSDEIKGCSKVRNNVLRNIKTNLCISSRELSKVTGISKDIIFRV